MKSLKLVVFAITTLVTALLTPSAAQAAPTATACTMYNDGSGIDVQLTEFVGQAIDLSPISDLTVTVDGSSHPQVIGARTYGSVLYISLSPSVPLSATSLSLSYARTSGGLTNGNGELLQDFTCTAPVHFGPTMASATTNSAGTQVIVTATSSVQTDNRVAEPTAWLVSNGSPIATTAVSVNDATITLTLETPVTGGQTVQILYAGRAPSSRQPLEFWLARNFHTVTNAAAWATPTVTSFSPAIGPVAGGTTVTITGTNLSQVSSVDIGGVPATSFTVDSATQITAITGPVVAVNLVGRVVASTQHGESGASAADFVYVRPSEANTPAPVNKPTFSKLSDETLEAGQHVTVTGTNLKDSVVRINGVSATVTSSTDTTLVFTVPSLTTGVATLELITTAGTTTVEKAFTVVETIAPPVIAPPVVTAKKVVYVGGFTGNTKILSRIQKTSVKLIAGKLTASVVCTGLVQGKATASARSLAKVRAVAVCAALKAAKPTVVVGVAVAVDTSKLKAARVKIGY